MPSVDDLLDRLCSEAKLNGTAASAERVLALSWLQEGADRSCGDAGVPVTSEATVTLTAGDPTYALDSSPFPTDMFALLDVSVTDSSVTGAPVQFVTPHAMQGRREGGPGVANGTPTEYSGDWPNLVLWPPPAAGTSLTITYRANAPTLVDNATAITAVPNQFQWGCWYEFAMYRAMQYKKQRQESMDHFAAYAKDRDAGLPALRRWAGSAMARQGAVQATLVSPVYSTSQDLGF